ncbi:MAG TPA: class I SAM-dependent methyltransferase [Pseudolabrys sp.]|nr:class I SAM-dependent methyltransferase [Pseudolabrys sp.]
MALTRLRRRLSDRYYKSIARRGLRPMSSYIQHVAAIFPHKSEAGTYTLPAYPEPVEIDAISGLPVPPEIFRAGYCTTTEAYLQSGRDDMAMLRKLLRESGSDIKQLGRILELGVAGGRLVRHLLDIASTQEIWGVDVWASAILWCQEHLSPPFHFATTPVLPHLPFEDRSFGLVFAGSVWTHIDDLAEAWALEVQRVLQPSGRFYFTINDRSAVKIFMGGGTAENRKRYIERIRPDAYSRWLKSLGSSEAYQRFARGEAQMVTMGRSTEAQVFWDAEYLLKRLGPGWRVCSVTPEAYGHQTGILLARR